MVPNTGLMFNFFPPSFLILRERTRQPSIGLIISSLKNEASYSCFIHNINLMVRFGSVNLRKNRKKKKVKGKKK